MDSSGGAAAAAKVSFHQPPINPFMSWLLRSPLHAIVSGSHLLVSYQGRQSGLQRAFPVQYAVEGTDFVILVGHAQEKAWWRNFRSPWPITVVHRGRPVTGSGVVVPGATVEGIRLARAYLHRFPRAGSALGLTRRANGGPDPAALKVAADGLTFVRVSPTA